MSEASSPVKPSKSKFYVNARFHLHACGVCAQGKGKKAKAPTLTVYVTEVQGKDKTRAFLCAEHSAPIGSRPVESISFWA